MSKFLLSDIFIGNFPQTQAFGVNPQNYAQFGLSGHNGLDFGLPNNSLIISAANGWIQEVGHDPNGYGNYVKVIHDGYLTIYAHLDHATVTVNDKVIIGQLLGISDNTGNSTGPHLHFGVAPCDINGIKTEANNGFAGYIDPNGDRCQWDIKNLTQPNSPIDPQPIPVDPTAQPMKQVIIDVYRAICGVEPSNDELQNRLNSGINTYDLVKDLLNNDGRSPLPPLKTQIDHLTTNNNQQVNAIIDLQTKLTTCQQTPPAPPSPLSDQLKAVIQAKWTWFGATGWKARLNQLKQLL